MQCLHRKIWRASDSDFARRSARLKELRSLYDHLQAKILEMIETLDELRVSPELKIFQSSEADESVIGEIVAVQREELEQEIVGLRVDVERVAEGARELAGEVPF